MTVTGLENISSILAIRFARVGDVVLLLPALARLKRSFPRARLTLMTGRRTAPIGELCPYVDAVMGVDRLRMRDGPRSRAVRDIIGLVRDVRARRFELVIDFHSFRETNLLAWLSGASYRLGMKRSDRAYLPFCFNLSPALEDKSLHVADMFQRVVEHIPGVAATPRVASPMLDVERAGQAWPEWQDTGPVIALYVGASVSERRWPASRFAAVASRMAREWGASILILSGRSTVEEGVARQVCVEAGIGGSVRLMTGLDIHELARTIASADVLISNDSGPMHIGSALGVPTLGIFSSSLPEHYRPRGDRDRYVKGASMDEIQVADVWPIVADMRPMGFPDRRP